MASGFHLVYQQKLLENVLRFFKDPHNPLSGFGVLRKDLCVLQERLNDVDRCFGLPQDSKGVQQGYKLLGWLPTELITNIERLDYCLRHITNGASLGDSVHSASVDPTELRNGLHERLRLHLETISLLGDYLQR
jgi:hypothetical protein